uniref:tRNA-dihydrouridine(47) synthase [NAD(P)(+)] n=1 Tax=Macrostomum lignano TaxID=282301 RepID=A0A1I8H830_9PLAT
ESAEPSTDQLEPKQQPAVSTAGYAAVKPEYLLPPAPAPAAESLANGQQQQTEQSKSRKRRPYLPDRPAECRSYFADGVCHFGVTCRLSHDLPAYLATRPPDLGPSCFVFDTTGRCPSGALCRFAGAHVDADGRNLADPDRQRAWAAAGQSELHGLDRDLQLALRRDDFDFGEAYALLLAPLTTVGNLPFRRICVDFGADVTCGEMAMASNLLQGRNAEWALLRRHPSERCFGAQVCGSHPDQLARLAQLLRDRAPHLDFVDLNCGCPIDLVYQRGMGAGMLTQPKRLETSVSCMAELLNCPLTVKVRTGVREGVNVAHELLPRLRAAGAAAVTIHGRSREQRYRRLADWDYIGRCTAAAKAALQDGSAVADDDDFFVIGNGDVFSPADLEAALATGVDAVMAPYAAAANGGVGSSNAGIPIFKEAGGKYVPPGLRQAAASGVGSPVGADKRRDDQPTIRVTNLPEDTTEEDLGHLFNPFGKIQRIFLAKDKQTMASKGFAFITYQRKEDAQKAILGSPNSAMAISSSRWIGPSPLTIDADI